MKKKVLLILLTPIAIVVLLALFFVFVVLRSDPNTSPVFFSLNDPKAYYLIKKTDGTDRNYPNYWVVHNNDEVFVGNSKVDLDPFVGKRISIKGNYSGRIAKQQCIINKCHPLTGAIIDIDSIQEVK